MHSAADYRAHDAADGTTDRTADRRCQGELRLRRLVVAIGSYPGSHARSGAAP
jgi:hypothetical protein